jgi:hypothetical protein
MNPRKPRIKLGAWCRVMGHKYPTGWRPDGVYICQRCPHVLRLRRGQT